MFTQVIKSTINYPKYKSIVDCIVEYFQQYNQIHNQLLFIFLNLLFETIAHIIDSRYVIRISVFFKQSIAQLI